MPKLDGYGATKRIRSLEDQEKANIPILAMTAKKKYLANKIVK